MNIITYREYMSGKKTYREWFSQFVTEGIKHLVKSKFSVDRLTEMYHEDKHFNSVPLKMWDSLQNSFLSGGFGINDKMKERGTFLTQSCIVCILKEAALQLIEEAPIIADKEGHSLKIGDSVLVDDPDQTDMHPHAFKGTIARFRNGNPVVLDKHLNSFEIEPTKLELSGQ